MPSSTGGRWRRGGPVGHPRVPGRCAEKRHHDGLVGTQPTDQSLPRQRSTLLTFRVRKARSKDGRYFSSFLPAMSDEAMKTKSAELRAMRIHRRTTWSLGDLARWLNPIVTGWMTYYGRFYRSAMEPLLQRVSTYLRRWAGKKYRRLAAHKRFMVWWTRLIERQPRLFAQWRWVRSF